MTEEIQTQSALAVARPTFREALRFWFKLGCISFGGPAGQIAIMQSELVEKKRWISQERFLHALNFCMLLPGPEAQQLAIYIGWLLHKTRGGIVAGTLFVFPSMFVLWALSYVYAAYGNLPAIAAISYGLKPAVLAIVLAAVIRIGRKSLRTPSRWALATAAFISVFFLKLPFPLIVLAAGAFGFFIDRASLGRPVEGAEPQAPHDAPPSWGRALRICGTCLTLWWLPIIAIGLGLGWQTPWFREGVFFSKAAVVTFGGAYAVLPYVAQQAVEQHHWLAPGQMMDGLGLAETTPGPLIMVLQFVGFMGGWNQPLGLSRLTSATLGALITTWATFVPCFMWVLLGAPHIERLRGNAKISSALSAVTGAVVGVILNLAIWFGLQVIFPVARGVDWFALLVATVGFFGMWRWKWGVIPVVIGSGLLGLVFKLVTKS